MSKTSPVFTSLARAKINLTLHVGVAREGGLHPLHSLVVFADIGDILTAIRADAFSLEIVGPFAGGLTSKNNLVLRAAKSAALINGVHLKLAYKLTKNLPISSGIGGGSADAGAAIRLLEEANGEVEGSLAYMLVETGADIPVCYASKTCLLQGIGEKLTPLTGLGQLRAVLVNPGMPVQTSSVFTAFDQNVSSSPFQLKGQTLLEMAKSGRNDLQEIAIQKAPIIKTVLDVINAQDGCELARMSGSGATCFGVFENLQTARTAASFIKKTYPDWWTVSTILGDIP